MKNQNQLKVVHLRAYEPYGGNQQVAYNRAGGLLNKSTIIKLIYHSVEWVNFFKNVRYLPYVQMEVAKVTEKSGDDYVEVKDEKFINKLNSEIHFAITGQELKAETKSNNTTESLGNGNDDTPEARLARARKEYTALTGNKGGANWKAETIEAKIKEIKDAEVN